MGIRQINPLLAAVLEDSLAHASPLTGSFDFRKVEGRWEKLARLDGQLPFSAITGAPNVDASKTLTLYRSDDAAFVETGTAVDFIDD